MTPHRVFYLLFALSGFAGLIYESIWSHYLKLFLGHAAYAQSLVLSLFMGGLALGSWLASRQAVARVRPLLAYAGIEALIGAFALVFHETFLALTEAFFRTLLPALLPPAAGGPAGRLLLAEGVKWLVAAVLIAPQSVLLGMTFPLLSGGIIRRDPAEPGATVAMLYFTNSLGAAAGVLASGFWLIGLLGLPGTIRVAGALNLAVAAAVFLLVRDERAVPAPPLAAGNGLVRDAGLTRLFLLGAFLTGAASFMYEIGWIRMLSLVLGSATHSFELMLCAFITGLAGGGLWVRRRVDRLGEPVRFAGRVQVAMGVLALLSIPVYAQSFGWMSALLQRLPPTDAGYAGFTLASHAIAMAVMLPATIAAGMTLPLFTFVAMRAGAGEAAIGRVYAANTVGAIAGVLFAVHVGLPLLGLKRLVSAGALLDIGLGLLLLECARRVTARRLSCLAPEFAGALVALVAVALLVRLEPASLASGVYRHGLARLPEDRRVAFYRDGKTATISVARYANGSASIATNGKPDARLQLQWSARPTPDEATMLLLAALPLAYHTSPGRVANIGFGSGLTAHAALADPRVRVLATVEIEPAMVEGARLFEPRVRRAFADPRSRVHIADAKTFFPVHAAPWDVIISEPSNPWVSGVASLFSTEFYALVSRHLAADGILTQWVQMYEFNDALFLSVLKALVAHFDDVVLYGANSADAVLIARRTGALGPPDFSRLLAGELGAELRRIGLGSVTDLLNLQLADRAALLRAIAAAEVPANSDYYPYVDLHAVRARFKKETAGRFLYLNSGG